MTQSNEDDMKYGIFVVELNDVAPRRHPELPNLYVTKTTMPLQSKYALTQRGKGPAWLRGNIVSLRHDLSIETSIPSPILANQEKRNLISQLASQGYTVNRNTDLWSVYVIELDPSITKKEATGCVYVGETKKAPETRFIEHMTKTRNGRSRLFSSVVAKHGLRLRPDLAPPEKYFDATASKAAEARWAEYLRSQGYVVKGGH